VHNYTYWDVLLTLTSCHKRFTFVDLFRSTWVQSVH